VALCGATHVPEKNAAELFSCESTSEFENPWKPASYTLSDVQPNLARPSCK
jgi:hypothetical protein